MTSTTPGTTAPRKRRQRVRYLDGDKLLKARLEVGLFQSELAARIREVSKGKAGAVSQTLVAMWERGRQGTSPEKVRWIAEALGKKPEDLMPDDLVARITPATGQTGKGHAA